MLTQKREGKYWFAPSARPYCTTITALSQICIQLTDDAGNGGRSGADLATHVTNDPLVLWAWDPGTRREPAPGTAATFAALIRAWADTGAQCPAP
jgi:hypothetical protein